MSADAGGVKLWRSPDGAYCRTYPGMIHTETAYPAAQAAAMEAVVREALTVIGPTGTTLGGHPGLWVGNVFVREDYAPTIVALRVALNAYLATLTTPPSGERKA